MLTEKKIFTLPNYHSVDGHRLVNVPVGYETYGELNAAKDNVVLICHFFSGTSHAAGRYKADDELAGYWDTIIGPGKAIDTDQYYVIATDALTNVNAKSPMVATFGPSSVNPATGAPYGMGFPVLRVEDWVHVQKLLLDSLGITTLKAVAGPSGGAVQAAVWGVTYPDMVERVLMAISPGHYMPPWAVAMLGAWASPIKLDPNWNDGDYHGSQEPVEGLRRSIELIHIMAMGYGSMETITGRNWAEPAGDPASALGNVYEAEAFIRRQAAARAEVADANALLYSVRAYQLYDIRDRLHLMKARVLLLPAENDMVFPPALSHQAKVAMEAVNIDVALHEIRGDGGHFEGLTGIAQFNEVISRFLAR